MAEKMADKVVRLMDKHTNIRNICTSAHIDHGKTTFSDNLLAGSGMMSEALAGKARALDFHEDEAARGITIDAASVSMVHNYKGKEYLFNLIDTPGHVDFGGDVTRAMRAIDGTIVLCCASEGIMPQTETVLIQALRERVKPVLFINKVDRLIKEMKLTPEAMQQRFVAIISKVNQLIEKIAEPEFKQKWKVNVADGSVAFGSAFHNWAMSVPYMQEKGISFKEIIDAYNDDSNPEAWKALAKKAPLHEVILNMSITHHPSPVDAQKYRIPKIWHGDLESDEGKALLACDPKGPAIFVVTKIVIDPQAGEICAGRLFSGTVKKGDTLNLIVNNSTVRVQQVSIYNGAKRDLIESAGAGNIIGLVGLKGAQAGETCASIKMEPFEKIKHIFDPVVTKAVEAKRPSDLPKLIEVLQQVSKEDPTIQIEINEETGEHLMSGMGELHLEIIENRILTEKHVEITTSPPIVVYREGITGQNPEPAEGKSPNKHNKLYFTVEPLEDVYYTAIKDGTIPSGRVRKKDEAAMRDKLVELGMDTKVASKVKDIYEGNMIIDGTRGIVYIGEIMELVLDMFEDVMRQGPVAREPCNKVKVTLVDCKLHEDAIHRGPSQLYPAVREGIREAMNNAKPIMLEPLQTMKLEGPIEYMGELSKLVQNMRGQLLDMEQDDAHVTVTAKIPVAETFGMSNNLRSATGGRGSSFVLDQTFERLPGELQEKVIKQIRQRKGLKE